MQVATARGKIADSMFAFAPKRKTTSTAAMTAAPARKLSRRRAGTHDLLHLQRAVGNQAARGLLRAKPEHRRIDRAAGSCCCGAAPAPSGLTVSHPHDRHEREADRVADAVMRMSDTDAARRPPVSSSGHGIQRRAASAEPRPAHHGPSLHARLDSLEGRGTPLPASERAFFEPRFGYDFSGVRVHADRAARDTAHAFSARAFTYGNDIVFGSGEYAPGTPSGRKLLAHELSHVVQQNSGRAIRQKMVQRRELRGESFPWDGVVANASWVWFRKKPNMADSSRVRGLKAGTQVKVTGVHGGWLKVEHNGVAGYMYKNYIVHKFEVDAKTQIGGVCSKAACLTKSGCTTSKCQKEAAIIAETYVSRVNQIRKPNMANVGDIHWGWMCYEWAGLLTREFQKLKLSCWKINWVGLVNSGGTLVHNYIYVSLDDITPSGTTAPKRDCGMILDPWRTGDPIVYDVSWLWHKWTYIHDPSTNKGKSYDGSTWTNRSYPPPWTPTEPTHSPTIKTR
jgi:hypothetical protein